jgi:hypothetical protein
LGQYGCGIGKKRVSYTDGAGSDRLLHERTPAVGCPGRGSARIDS